MPQTLQILIPWLQLAAGPASGMIASWLFTYIRHLLPKDLVVPWLAPVLYAPRYARIAALILAALIALIASMLVAALSNGNLPAALDAALAAALAGVASQLTHAAQLPTEVPTPPTESAFVSAGAGWPPPYIHPDRMPPPNQLPPGPPNPPRPPRDREVGVDSRPQPLDRRFGSRAGAYRKKLPGSPEEDA